MRTTAHTTRIGLDRQRWLRSGRPRTSPTRAAARRWSPAPTAASGSRRRASWPRAGASVVLACRNTDKGEAARRRDHGRRCPAPVEVAALDLADLDSVRAFAERLRADARRLDLLINNAGVMAPPRSDDRRRLRAAVRHQPPRPLRPHRPAARAAARAARTPRVVTRQQHRATRCGRINFDDLQRRAPLPPLARLRAVEARQPAVRVRAGPPPARRRLDRDQRRRPPRLRRHQPAGGGAARGSTGRSWR